MTGFELILPFLRPIEHLILDPEISEVMVNDPEHVFVERAGMMRRYCEYLLAASHLTVVRNIAHRQANDTLRKSTPRFVPARWIDRGVPYR